VQLSINQATAQTTPTLELLDACAEAGVGQVAPWRHQYVDGDVRATRRALDERGLRASSLCRGGFFTGTRPADEARRDNRAAVEEAAVLGAPVLVLVCGPVTGAGGEAARAAIKDGIEELLPFAAEHDVVLAVEPFHPMMAAERSAIVTLDQATDLVAALDHPALGIAVDTYHVWWDPELSEALHRAAPHVRAVHVGDWLVPTESLTAGRGLPGDGIVDLRGILATLAADGYDGAVEVEVLHPDVWARPVRSVVADVRARMRALVPGLVAA
jgi:sugar phosphate isomerase/epimerase